MTPYVKLFRGKNKQWYFHRIAGNGQVTASSEGYQRRDSARRAARKNYPKHDIREPQRPV